MLLSIAINTEIVALFEAFDMTLRERFFLQIASQLKQTTPKVGV